MNKKILVSIAWPYVNGNIHVGHLAGYLIPADITARFHRLKGNDVLMVSGSDCHGTPITVEADKTNKTSQEVVDHYHKQDIDLFNKYKLSYNLYTKTTTENHKQVAQELFLNLLEKDYITTKTEKQYYSEEDKKYLPDRYVEGTCPYCSTKDQRGDQCENCGRMIEQGTLVDPISKLTGNPVVLKDTEHYYIDLSKLQKELEQYVDDKKEIWKEWVFNETQGWLNDGLLERAITRDIDWGIEIPAEEIKKKRPDMLIDNIENKRFYVWFEAVIGYLSASREWSSYAKATDSADNASNVIYNKFNGQADDWKDWWIPSSTDNSSDVYHYYFMGQDNVVFHTIMWPAELIGAYKDIHLPDNVAANKFMNFKGRKFSKSRGWVVDSNEIADEFGIDAVRFFISANLPEKKESNFTWEEFVDTVNNELVANLGNFINRTLVFASKNFPDGISNMEVDAEVKKVIDDTFNDTAEYIQGSEITKAVQSVMKLSSFGNKYFNDSEVWKVIKKDKDKATEIIFNCLSIVEALSTLMYPFTPDASNQLRMLLDKKEMEYTVGVNRWIYNNPKGFKINSPKPLFSKLDKEEVLKNKNAE